MNPETAVTCNRGHFNQVFFAVILCWPGTSFAKFAWEGQLHTAGNYYPDTLEQFVYVFMQ